MTNKEMPAAEANSYELAFHVLPTVAEGEVATVFQSLKDQITKHGGEITTEEAPARCDLAYEIIKHLEGRNRKFASAYFGWVRFTMSPDQIEALGHEVEANGSVLRHLIVKLTKAEEANPFFYHEAMAELGKSETIDVDEESKEESSDEKAADAEEIEETKEDDETKEDKA